MPRLPLGYDPDPALHGEGSSRTPASTSLRPPKRARLMNPVLPTPSLLIGGGKPRRQRRTGGAEPRPRATRSRRGSATPVSLESIAAESDAVRAEVVRLGLSIRKVAPDGNCLFRALSDQLWGDQSRHVEVRKRICDHLEQHPEDVGDFVAGFLDPRGNETYEESYARYVDNMRQQGTYGSHVELLAACKVFRRSIRLVLSQTSHTVEFESTSPAPKSKPKSDDADSEAKEGPETTTSGRRRRAKGADSAPVSVPDAKEGHSMLWLAFFAEAEHYDSIRKGSGSGPAEVPDSLAVPHSRDVSELARRERGDLPPEEPSRRSGGKNDKLAQVYASLPPNHGLSDEHVAGVLARVKGDIGEAVEILLEDIDLEAEAGSQSSNSSAHVEAMLSDKDAYRERLNTPSSEEYAASPSDSASTAPTSPLGSQSEREDPEPATEDDKGGHLLRSGRRTATPAPPSAPSSSGPSSGPTTRSRRRRAKM